MKAGRQADRYIFANSEAGRILVERTQGNLAHVGITSEASEEMIDHTLCLVVTVTGKRPGEGKIAADMKARKHAVR